MSPTPDVVPGCASVVGGVAAILVASNGREGDAPPRLEDPVVLEVQFGLIVVSHLLLVVQQLNGDFRRVEETGLTDQDVFLAKDAWLFAEHLHLRRLCGADGGHNITLLAVASCKTSGIFLPVSLNVGLIKVSIVFHTILFYHSLSPFTLIYPILFHYVKMKYIWLF